jgi:hypothetical protein
MMTIEAVVSEELELRLVLTKLRHGKLAVNWLNSNALGLP